MIDLQATRDNREVNLSRVGVSGLALPVKIREKVGGFQHVSATAGLFVDVPADIRGTHLSRFVELLNEWANEPVSSRDIEGLLREIQQRVDSTAAEATLKFKYFLPRAAPVSGRVGMLDYDCAFFGSLTEQEYAFVLGVTVPISTVCPCSKEISDRGAHNQRATVDVRVTCSDFVWLEDLVSLVEQEASCPVYPVLKRTDEKSVTEAAYDNPKFVEDVVRDVVLLLRSHPEIVSAIVTCESQESIHNHSAYAEGRYSKTPVHEEPAGVTLISSGVAE